MAPKAQTGTKRAASRGTDAPAKQSRVLRRLNSDQDTQRVIYDNFVQKHGFTSEQTDVMKAVTLGRGPMTLRETIKADKKLVLARNPLAPKIGGTYYSGLRTLYRLANDPRELLKPAPEKNGELIAKLLLQAMVATKKMHMTESCGPTTWVWWLSRMSPSSAVCFGMPWPSTLGIRIT